MKRLALLAAALGLTACTPHQAVWLHFGDDPQLHRQARTIVACETGGTWDAGAVSPTDDHGIFQINERYHRASFERVTGQPWSKVYDPQWNAAYARHLYEQSGWTPWTCRSAL